MWVELTPEILLAALSGPERDALSRAAVGPAQEDALGEIAANIAAEWRGGLRRVVRLDARPLYVPDELLTHILADYRYRAFTRLPGMSRLLDEPRREEWRRANAVRDNIHKLSIAPPDENNAETIENSGRPGPAIGNPKNPSKVTPW
jgi:hypothetical protein